MKIDNLNYSLEYFQKENKIVIKGNLTLQSIEKYNEIMAFIFKYAFTTEDPLVIDLTQLSYINSSGIASLSLFFIKIKDTNKKIKIIAAKYSPWQTITLKDLQIINSNVEIEYICHH